VSSASAKPRIHSARFGGHSARFWRALGACLAGTWRALGACLAGIRQVFECRRKAPVHAR
jgi:hypothetical protein